MKFTIHQSSRRGGRRYNQDRLAYSYSKHALLMVVADGMGGYSHGEMAAQLAVKTLTAAFQQMAAPSLLDPDHFLRMQIQKIHEAIHHLAKQKSLEEIPKTTIVASIVQDDTLYCAHVGDSRLYHIRQRQLLYRTEDHSIIQMMLKQGLVKAQDMSKHPDRNKIYNCLGGETPPTIDISKPRALHQGDIILLCSDGLWGHLSDERIVDILNNGMSINQNIPGLIDTAERRGGDSSDNISAAGMQWGSSLEDALTISTLHMPLENANTIMSPITGQAASPDAHALADLTEDDIDRAIAEIQVAINRSKR
ncbi:protein phosphatase 2C domain-containing protein [Methylobacillus gramineus]|uniref:PP2C family protein-serine/threonine phosphatase n=1 Tax=Methylobacillus gramineus TaxID=755169 RepID=UPI001CFFB178|nr:protein phosphatase 2C domain-containing protein [Methylobacillus gramineus]MCB5185669.1 protein phosphatase 2C domain-containing protein [Methylobacillus gramineus]